MDEIWKPVADWTHYEVSNLGKLRNVKTGRILKDSVTGGEYRKYTLCQDGKKIHIQTHRLVAKTFISNPTNLPQVDHINGNKLDNTVSNLRWASVSDNARNRAKQANNTSGFKGVSVHKDKFQAHIRIDGKSKHLGLFATKEEAYKAYCAAARTHYGEFARLV